MSVEAIHLLPIKSIITINTIDNDSDHNYCLTTQYIASSLSGTTNTTTAAVDLLPMYSSVFINQDPLKTDTDLTYNLPVSRKRSRDFSSMCTSSDALNVNRNHNHPVKHFAAFTFLGEDISSQIQQQQFEIDQFITRQVKL